MADEYVSFEQDCMDRLKKHFNTITNPKNLRKLCIPDEHHGTVTSAIQVGVSLTLAVLDDLFEDKLWLKEEQRVLEPLNDLWDQLHELPEDVEQPTLILL